MSKEAKKKPNKGVPLPKARDKVYTVQENKLLDQITMELCEAWRKDLRVIRECFAENKKLSELLQEMYADLKPRMDEIGRFVEQESKLNIIRELKQNQLALACHFDDLRKEVLSISNLLSRESKKEVQKQKKWWQFWK